MIGLPRNNRFVMKIPPHILLKTHGLWSRFLPRRHRLYELPTGGRVFIDIAESPMMFARVIGRFEPEKHRGLDFFLAPGDGFLDIGANKGEFAIHAALAVGEEGRVVAFEPEPENCTWIRRSLEQSGVPNVTLEQSAVGAEDGSAELFLGDKSGWHSLVGSGSEAGRKSITVQVRQLDAYLHEHPIANLKAIKIDVEGFEKEVLVGAGETLSRHDDLVLFVDIHPGFGVRHEEIYGILRGHGFSIYQEVYPFDIPVAADARPKEIVAVKGTPSAS